MSTKQEEIKISFISSFEVNKVNPFSALTAPCPLMFLSKLFIASEAKLLPNTDKLSLAKGIALSVSAFSPKFPKQELKDSPGSLSYLDFTTFYIC